MSFDDVIQCVKDAFGDSKAWAYAVEDHRVQTGICDGGVLDFEYPITPEYLQELRIFKGRELRVVPNGEGSFLLRDSDIYDNKSVIDDKYIMYGENISHDDGSGFMYLSEMRGGSIRFPKRVEFQIEDGKPIVEMKLCVRQFWRYNEIPVLPLFESDTSAGLNPYGQGALEIYDFAFIGFYAFGKEVELP